MKVCIDPGHGMGNRTAGVFDSGATAGGRREADIALAYAQSLRTALTALGVDTFLTRDSNSPPAPLVGRVKAAEQNRCTHFVSLHCNAAGTTDANGVEVLYRDAAKDLPLARALQKRLVAASGFRDRSTKLRTDLAVLKFAPGPAVLIEMGFITNHAERAALLTEATRGLIIGAIVDALGLPARASSPAPAPPVLPPGGGAAVSVGKMSTFGGPRDTGVSPSEGLALIEPAHLADPRIAALFLDKQPPGTTGLARKLNPDRYYIAMRWEYARTSKAFLRSVRVLVANPRTGASLEASPVDWGPNARTGRVADLSPGLAAALGLKTDEICQVTVPLPRQEA